MSTLEHLSYNMTIPQSFWLQAAAKIPSFQNYVNYSVCLLASLVKIQTYNVPML